MRHTFAFLLLLAACKAEPGDDTGGASSGGTTGAPTTNNPTTGGTTEAPTTNNPTVSGTSTDGGTTEAPTTNNPTVSTSTDATTTVTGGSTGGTTGGDPSPACVTYCSGIAQNCSGALGQYAGEASCLGVCATFPPGMDGDVAGNSLACRTYHTGAAADDAPTHCVHAGPGGAGACGSNCDGFCSIATAVCPGEYPDADACKTACMGFDDSEKYDAGDSSGNTLACRLYHLTVAATDAGSAATHCPHTVADSPVCK